jgi:hypothetical protein
MRGYKNMPVPKKIEETYNGWRIWKHEGGSTIHVVSPDGVDTVECGIGIAITKENAERLIRATTAYKTYVNNFAVKQESLAEAKRRRGV